MKSLQSLLRALAVSCLAAVVAVNIASAQQAAEKKEEYQPSVGQAGKDVVWVPTPQELVDKMLDMAKVTDKDYVIDLGSGDGRTVITAAKRGARAVGIEYNPDMVALSRKNAEKEGVKNATFINGDIFKEKFNDADVLTMFLLPSLNVQLRPTILDMKPGTRVVSNSFDMGDWEADESFSAGDGCSSWCRAHYWMVPAKVEGRWLLGDGELTLTQKYQKLSGTLKTGNVVAPLADGAKMKGDEIVFTAGGKEYTGKVSGNAMEGTIKDGGAWKATKG